MSIYEDSLADSFKDSPVWGAAIFGSVADDSYDSVSDLDIIVFADSSLGYEEYMQLYLSLDERTDRDIDLVDYTTAKSHFLQAVLENHTVIYGDEGRIASVLNSNASDESPTIKHKDDIVESTI